MDNQKLNFTKFSKTEILNNLPTENCCKRAWLAGAVKAIGSLHLETGGRASLIFETEDLEYLGVVVAFARELYGCAVTIEPAKFKDGKRVGLSTAKLPHEHSMQLLVDSGIVGDDNGVATFIVGVKPEVIALQCCAKAFLKSLYIAAGSANVPSKLVDTDGKITSSGGSYYLEFVLSDEQLAELIIKVLGYFEIQAKLAERKGKYVAYLKDSELISNVYALFSASETVLYLQEILLERQMTNTVNRQSNCDAANADKTAQAAAKQVLAIEYIAATVGLDALPEKLRELAELRLKNIDEPLEFFTEAQSDKPTKSGINHRFRKITALADELRQKKGN